MQRRLADLELNEPHKGAVSLFVTFPAIINRLQEAGLEPRDWYQQQVSVSYKRSRSLRSR